jgi:hypothetical protein
MDVNAFRFIMTRRRKSNQKQISKKAIKEELWDQYMAYGTLSSSDSRDNMWEAKVDVSGYWAPPVTLSSSTYIDESLVGIQLCVVFGLF